MLEEIIYKNSSERNFEKMYDNLSLIADFSCDECVGERAKLFFEEKYKNILFSLINDYPQEVEFYFFSNKGNTNINGINMSFYPQLLDAYIDRKEKGKFFHLLDVWYRMNKERRKLKEYIVHVANPDIDESGIEYISEYFTKYFDVTNRNDVKLDDVLFLTDTISELRRADKVNESWYKGRATILISKYGLATWLYYYIGREIKETNDSKSVIEALVLINLHDKKNVPYGFIFYIKVILEIEYLDFKKKDYYGRKAIKENPIMKYIVRTICSCGVDEECIILLRKLNRFFDYEDMDLYHNDGDYAKEKRNFYVYEIMKAYESEYNMEKNDIWFYQIKNPNTIEYLEIKLNQFDIEEMEYYVDSID